MTAAVIQMATVMKGMRTKPTKRATPSRSTAAMTRKHIAQVGTVTRVAKQAARTKTRAVRRSGRLSDALADLGCFNCGVPNVE